MKAWVVLGGSAMFATFRAISYTIDQRFSIEWWSLEVGRYAILVGMLMYIAVNLESLSKRVQQLEKRLNAIRTVAARKSLEEEEKKLHLRVVEV